ncbi:MAG: sensor histidine kinase [Actinomycetes bacterium]
MPLRWRMAVVFAAATAVVLAVGGLVLVNLVHRSLEDSINGRLSSRQEVLSRLVWSYGDELRTRPLQTDRLDWPYPSQSDQMAQVYAPDGALVQSIQVPYEEPLLTPEEVRAARHAPLQFRARPGSSVGGDLVRATPAADQDGGVWVIAVGTDVRATDDILHRLRTGLLVAGPIVIGLSALGAWLLAGSSLRPVERLRRRAAELSADDTAASLPVPGTGDEIAALASTMNDLLHRLQDALSRERRFVADAGHELRTPLTVLRAELELASRPGRSLEELREAVDFAGVEADRLIRLAEHLLLLARIDEGRALVDAGPTNVNAVLEAAVKAAAARAEPGVEVVLHADEHVDVAADAERVRQAVDNLLDNALRLGPPGEPVTVALRTGGRRGRRAVIDVCDRGPGFPPDFLPRAFERFERADVARARDSGGSGLGLAIVRSLARAHGGDAYAENMPDGGACVRVELPVAGSRGRGGLPRRADVATRRS